MKTLDTTLGLFQHEARAPHVPTEPQVAYQRRFGERSGRLHPEAIASGGGINANGYALPRLELSVYRDGEEDMAELQVTLHRAVDVTAYLAPQALRELAARLLDAAHDIEAHPAADLTRERDAAH